MKSKILSTFSHGGLRPICVLNTFAAIVIAADVEPCRAGWTRGLPIGEVAIDERKTPESFVLEVWSGDDDGHVYGLCMYFNDKSVASIIEGVEAPDGNFYPKVSKQVADSACATEWKTLEEAISVSGKAAIRTIPPQEASRQLKVDLDVFRPFIGKGKYGRLTLKTGDAAIFQIDDLQPPEKKTESSADFVRERK